MATSIVTAQREYSLSKVFAAKYGVDPGKVFSLLKDTVLKSKEGNVGDAEVAAFMIVANQYDLNPFIKEIFGFISKGKMQYVISVDGWATLVNRQPNLNGIEFSENFDEKGNIFSITCRIHRKDRALPTVITEYYSECRGSTETWAKWPIRMLRHKALIQCARIAFGLAGAMDEDEAERMAGYPAEHYKSMPIEGQVVDREADALEKALKWSTAKCKVARSQCDSRDEYLAMLRKSVEAAGINMPRATGIEATAEPEGDTAVQSADDKASEATVSESQPSEMPVEEKKTPTGNANTQTTTAAASTSQAKGKSKWEDM